MTETFKTINSNTNYQISNKGRVKSNRRGIAKILKPSDNGHGYLKVCLDGKWYYIHRLVADVFIPNPHNLPQVNHKDCNRYNNDATNLEWCDMEYNNGYADRGNKIRKALTNHKGKSKPVIQYTIDNEFVKEWPSIREVERELGFNSSAISRCCRGELKQMYGYKWQYAV